MSELSPALLSAERLAGNGFTLGLSTVELLMQPSPQSRIRSVLPVPLQGVIVSGSTAAWVWGALRNLSLPLEFAVPIHNRKSVRHTAPFVKRELAITDAEYTVIGERLITTRERTALDLLQNLDIFSARERTMCRLLLMNCDNGAKWIADYLTQHRRIPHAKRARDRLQHL